MTIFFYSEMCLAWFLIEYKDHKNNLELTFIGLRICVSAAAGPVVIALVHPLLVHPGLLVTLEVGAGLKPLWAVAAEVRTLPGVSIQMLPQMRRLFKSEYINKYEHMD